MANKGSLGVDPPFPNSVIIDTVLPGVFRVAHHGGRCKGSMMLVFVFEFGF